MIICRTYYRCLETTERRHQCHHRPYTVNTAAAARQRMLTSPGVVTVFTSQELATVKYAQPSRVRRKLHLCTKSAVIKRLLLERASQFLLAVNYKFCPRAKTSSCGSECGWGGRQKAPVSRTDERLKIAGSFVSQGK